MSLVAMLLADVPAEEIGVITPYSAQTHEVRRQLRARRLPAAVEARTVDGFQGREKELILLSCVRSNREGRLGFLADARRLNVALTRGRRGLIVVGSRRTLRHDPTWAALVAHCEAHAVVLDEDELVARGLLREAPARTQQSSR